jgi:DNA repair protein SbcC/Rad50
MIKRVTIKNFQSHQETVLDLTPGANIFIGESQSGKTAIIRAILWVLTNKPSGFGFHSHFAGKEPTSVTLEMMDGGSVTLTKNSSKAVYKLVLPNGKEEEFSGMGQNVPDEVTRFLNMGEVNISKQLELPFLIADSPTEAGKVISRLIHLEKVEDWASEVGSKIRECSGKLKDFSAQLTDMREEVKTFADLPQLKTKQGELSALVNLYTKYCADIESLATIIPQLKTLRFDISAKTIILSHEPSLILLQEKIDQFKKIEWAFDAAALTIDKIKNLTMQIDIMEKTASNSAQLDQIQEKIEAYSDVVKSLDLINVIIDTNDRIHRMDDQEARLSRELRDTEGALAVLSACSGELKDVNAQLKSIYGFIDAIATKNTSIFMCVQEQKDLKVLYANSLRGLKKCPTCFSDIDEKHIVEILEEV